MASLIPGADAIRLCTSTCAPWVKVTPDWFVVYVVPVSTKPVSSPSNERCRVSVPTQVPAIVIVMVRPPLPPDDTPETRTGSV